MVNKSRGTSEAGSRYAGYTLTMTESFEKITMFGADWCGDCRRSAAFFAAAGIDYDYIDLVAEPEQARRAEQISGRKNIPVIVFPNGTVLVEPSNDQLAAAL